MSIDYSKFSLEDLRSALASIDRERYPDNHARLVRQLEAKEAEAAAGTPVPDAGPVYASGWRRLGAGFIDAVIMIPAVFLLVIAAATSFWAAIASYVTLHFLFVGYQVYFHARRGATPGKGLLGIKVVKEDLAPLDFRTAVLRSAVDIGIQLFQAVMAVIVIASHRDLFPFADTFGIVGIFETGLYDDLDDLYNLWWLSEAIVCLTNRRRKAIHDFLAGTVVIRTGRN